MNPVKLKFRHGGEMLVSPIGLRFVEDPEHGPLVLIPEAQGPRAYQLDMTLEEAQRAFARASDHWDERFDLLLRYLGIESGWIGRIGTSLHPVLPGLEQYTDNVANRLDTVASFNADRWKALKIHLGLPEGWEHLHEGAAEVKGALVSQAELIDKLEYSAVSCARWCGSLEQRLAAVEKELSLLKEEASLFTLAERVGELEESRRAAFQRLCDAELRLHSLEDRHRQMTNEAEGFRRDVENDRVCAQRQSIHPHLPSHWSAAKPKSAWRPLTEAEPRLMQVNIRVKGLKTVQVAHRASAWSDWRVRGDVQVIGADNVNYEFCPIPE